MVSTIIQTETDYLTGGKLIGSSYLQSNYIYISDNKKSTTVLPGAAGNLFCQ